MDEKEIVQIIARYWDTAKYTNWMELAAAELAQLFEREMAERDGRVLWEGEGIAEWCEPNQTIGLPVGGTLIALSDTTWAFYVLPQLVNEGWREPIRVVIYEEKRPEFEKATESAE